MSADGEENHMRGGFQRLTETKAEVSDQKQGSVSYEKKKKKKNVFFDNFCKYFFFLTYVNQTFPKAID